MRETLGSQGVQTLLGKLKDQEKKTEDAEKKENRQKIKERWIPMILLLRTLRRRAKKQKRTGTTKNQGDFRMQEMGMILPAVLIKAWKILFRSSEESVNGTS